MLYVYYKGLLANNLSFIVFLLLLNNDLNAISLNVEYYVLILDRYLVIVLFQLL